MSVIKTLFVLCFITFPLITFPVLVTADTLGISDIRTDRYGYRYKGVNANRKTAQFTFLGTNENLTLTLTGFDIDLSTEVEVLVNQQIVGYLSVTRNDRSGPTTLSIPASSQIEGENSLAFNQRKPGWRWGITDLLLSVDTSNGSDNSSTNELLVDIVERARFGFRYRGIVAHRDTAQFVFQGNDDDITLNLTGFDIDTATEVEVLVNQQNVGYLSVTRNNRSGPSTLSIPASSQIEGENSLSFRQSNPGWRWGITKLLLSRPTPPLEVPTPPTPLSPVENAVIETDKAATFSWQHSEFATSYVVEIPDNSAQLTTLDASACSAAQCSVQIDLDVTALADYTWRVAAINSAGTTESVDAAFHAIAAATDAPASPALLSPEEATDLLINEPATFTWVHDPMVAVYGFHFFNSEPGDNQGALTFIEGLSPRDICSNGICEFQSAVSLPAFSEHTWNVRAGNSLGQSAWSGRVFNAIEPITDPPAPPTPISPMANAVLEQDSLSDFSWSTSETAKTYSFELIDSQSGNPSASNILVSAENCSAETCSLAITLDLPISEFYEWRVRATNEVGDSAWSTTPIEIIAKPIVPASPLIVIAPLANTPVQADQSVSFQWQHDTDALTYEFYLSDADSGSQPSVTQLAPDDHCMDSVCSYSHVVSLLPGNLHSWHVRARYADNDSQWSDTPLTVEPAQSEPDVYLIEDTNVDGGGFQGDVSITDDGLTVYSSADNSGVFKSSDGGLRFDSYNEGLHSNKIASLSITPDNNQILYSGTGNKGTSGGLFRSVDGAETWVLTGDGANAQFSGNHTGSNDPLPGGHPRSVGDLIVVDPGNNPSTYTDDIVIAGSYKDGVRLFSQGGESEASAVQTSGFVRSVARSPALPDVAFAAIQFSDSTKNGIYKIDYSDLSNPVSTLEYPALRPEGLTVLSSGHVYAAISAQGIVKFDGSTWALQNSGLSINNPNRQWTAVAGYVIDDQDVVYAGTNNRGGTASGAAYSNIWRTLDGGSTWTALVDSDFNVDDTVYGQSYDWWFRVGGFGEAGLGRRNSVVSSIDIATGPSASLVSDDIIYVSGRGGIWKSDNGGNSWQPTVTNMRATSNYNVAVNPNFPSQLVLANTDYVVLETRSGFKGDDISRDKPAGVESRGYDAIFDAVSNEIIVSSGNRDSNNPGGGDVFVKAADALGAPSDSGWTDTNLRAATAANNGRVRAVTYGYHDGSAPTGQTILAAVDDEGVFRYHDGTWSKSTGVSLGLTHRSKFVWPDSANSGVVYLLDLSVGLYRSNDGGQTWLDIWPSMSLRNNNFYNTGYIAADDNNPTTLYVSIQGNAGSPIGTKFRVFRMVGADVAIFDEPGTTGITDITSHSGGTSIQRPGPLALSPDGSLWLTEQQNSKNSIDAGLYVMENPVTDVSFTEVTTDQYRNIAITPIGMDISSDGYIYISQDGGGVVKVTMPCRFHSGC